MKEEIKKILDELKDFDLDEHDLSINELKKKAIREHFKDRLYILDEDIQIRESVKDSIKATEEHLIKAYGSVENKIRIEIIRGVKTYLSFVEAKVKENKIINIRTYQIHNAFISFVGGVYDMYEYLIHNRNLRDRSEIMNYIEDNNLKEKAYKPFGVLTIKDMSFNLFTNGRLDITFKDNEIAEKILREVR